MFSKYRRYYHQMWTYGIGHDLTPREKKMWVTLLYVLIGMASYYQIKDQARSFEQGEWSLWNYLFNNKEEDINVHTTPVNLTEDQMRQLFTQLLNSEDKDLEILRDIWVQTDDTELTKTQAELKAAILAEYEARNLSPF